MDLERESQTKGEPELSQRRIRTRTTDLSHDQLFLLHLARLAQELKRPPSAGEYLAYRRCTNRDLASGSEIYRWHGSWTAALLAAGLEPPLPLPQPPAISVEEALASICRAEPHLEHNGLSSYLELRLLRPELGLPHPARILQHFSGWRHALLAAGAEPRLRDGRFGGY